MKQFRALGLIGTLMLLWLPPSTVAQQPRPSVPRLPSFELFDLSGRKQTLQDLKGKGATLINFFFPGCSACNTEMPHLKALYEKYRDQGFELISINLLPEQNGWIAEWAKRGGYSHPILKAPRSGGSLAQRYFVRSTPTNYLVDGDGWPVRRWRGYAPGNEKRMEKEIRQLLGLEAGEGGGRR
ncbi:MAG: TlpA disulfide reductase family protein [Acidobacteriota bacterium]